MSIDDVLGRDLTGVSDALRDFTARQDPHNGHLVTRYFRAPGSEHAHVFRGVLGACPLYAVAFPDPVYAARITVAGSCPQCTPPGWDLDPQRCYAVEYGIPGTASESATTAVFEFPAQVRVETLMDAAWDWAGKHARIGRPVVGAAPFGAGPLHLHIWRGVRLGDLAAVALPDPALAARIVPCSLCPVCDPQSAAAPVARYLVEYEITSACNAGGV